MNELFIGEDSSILDGTTILLLREDISDIANSLLKDTWQAIKKFFKKLFNVLLMYIRKHSEFISLKCFQSNNSIFISIFDKGREVKTIEIEGGSTYRVLNAKKLLDSLTISEKMISRDYIVDDDGIVPSSFDRYDERHSMSISSVLEDIHSMISFQAGEDSDNLFIATSICSNINSYHHSCVHKFYNISDAITNKVKKEQSKREESQLLKKYVRVRNMAKHSLVTDNLLIKLDG